MSWYTFARPSSHVTTDYLYLALLLLTSIAISFSISIVASHTFAGLVFLSGPCLHLTFYLLFKWFHIFNHTAVKPNAQIHSKCTSSTFWKKTGCCVVRASRPAYSQTNWIHTNTIKLIVVNAFCLHWRRFFLIWRKCPKDVNIVGISSATQILAGVIPVLVGHDTVDAFHAFPTQCKYRRILRNEQFILTTNAIE